MTTPSRRVFALGMVVQALGAAATFATGLVIAWQLGPAAQGLYGQIRTTADLLLALALFGLPMSVVNAVHRQRVSPARLARACAWYGGGLLAVWVVAAMLVPATPGWISGPWALIALGLTVCGWLVHGLWRVLVLVLGDSLRFALASAAPAMTLLAAVLVALMLGSQRFEWSLAASGACSVLFVAWQLRKLRRRPAWGKGGPVSLSALVGGGALAAAPTVALTLQPWLTLVLLERAGAAVEEIGWFVLACLFQQAFALPASFVAPLLLERVSRTPDARNHFPVRRWFPPLAVTAAAAALVAPLLPWLVPLAFGPEYEAAVPACIWMTISGPFVVAGRFAMAVLQGQGAQRAASACALARALAVPVAVGLALAAVQVGRPAAAALAWLVIEAAAFVLAAWLLLSRHRNAG